MTTDLAEATLPNGLRVAAERVPGARSAAFALLAPLGSANDPEGASGEAAVVEEWLLRGAGDRDARALSEAMDAIGLDRTVETGAESLVLSGALLARDLPRALELAADVALRPRLDDSEFEPCRDLALQAIESLHDSPASLCMVELGRRFLPSPLGRSPYGEADEIRALDPARSRESVRRRLGPRGAVFAVAGAIDPAEALRRVEDLLGPWSGGAGPVGVSAGARGPGPARDHVERPGAQVQIGVAYDEAGPEPPASDLAQLAAIVLSGGMGARLFVEVREKRGLVYAVRASYRPYRGLGAVFAYAGTTPERAGETLDVLLGELRRIGEGATPEEFDRAKVRYRSHLVMQGESTRGRAAALANDLFRIGRARPLDEALAAVERTTLDDLNAHLAARAPRDFTVLTLGPRPAAAAA